MATYLQSTFYIDIILIYLLNCHNYWEFSNFLQHTDAASWSEAKSLLK